MSIFSHSQQTNQAFSVYFHHVHRLVPGGCTRVSESSRSLCSFEVDLVLAVVLGGVKNRGCTTEQLVWPFILWVRMTAASVFRH